MSKPAARRAILRPIAPKPSRPNRLPETLGCVGRSERQTPARQARSNCGMARTAASSSAIAWSATQSSFVPAPLATTTPRDLAWATAMFS